MAHELAHHQEASATPEVPDVPEASEAVDYPGARPPDRVRQVDAHGVRLAVHEWGDPAAPPLALAHGGFDFARTFDVFAPLLADAGWRVVAWDQRGHGDSEHAALYTLGADVRDAAAVLDSIGPEPLRVIGHSKGGSLLMALAAVLPHRVSRLVNLDGLPSRRNWPDVADHLRTKLRSHELAAWLDYRRATVDAIRRAGTIDEVAARRGRMNPRLPEDWLRRLVTVGGRHDPDGWRWKIDPAMRLGGFGPWRPEWALRRLAALGMPFLAILGLEVETMGWGTRPEDVEPDMPPSGRLLALKDVGHFVHIEQPQRVAGIVLDFLGPPGEISGNGVVPSPASDRLVRSLGDKARRDSLVAARENDADAVGGPAIHGGAELRLRHNRIDLALHRLRDGDADGDSDGHPLLLLHGLAEQSPAEAPHHVTAWPGPIWALDFTGHGSSTVPAGGGYFAEILMADVDIALAHLGPSTLYGRGLGAYVALLTAGSRPGLVRGAILDDGPGLEGGGSEPGATYVQTEPLHTSRAPDPYARLELSNDIRPTDYAATFAHQAATLSGLDVALAVVGAVRPAWLGAVVQEPGVLQLSRSEALALFARPGPGDP